MLTDYLNEDLIALDVEASNAIEAIIAAGQLLMDANKINESYIHQMIESYQTLGSYIVLAPHIAMPHAKPCGNVFEPCVAFVRLKKPVVFHHPQNDPVHFVLALGGADEYGHIKLLQSLSSFLMDSDNLEKMYQIKSKHELMELINRSENNEKC